MKKLSNKQNLIIMFAVDIILIGVFFIVKNRLDKKTVENQITEQSVRQICELSTLDCFYHNVFEWVSPGGFFQPGKKLWLEYDGVIRVGIKADEIKISEPDQDGVITVTIPPATILDKDLDENSIYEIDSESSLLGFLPIYRSVSVEERKEALANAQIDMELSASKNEMILSEAKERAKKILENNIILLGEASGKHYKVRFIEDSETPSSASSEEIP